MPILSVAGYLGNSSHAAYCSGPYSLPPLCTFWFTTLMHYLHLEWGVVVQHMVSIPPMGKQYIQTSNYN
jgi:hypothetical protein